MFRSYFLFLLSVIRALLGGAIGSSRRDSRIPQGKIGRPDDHALGQSAVSAYAEALASLPLFPREVYRLLRDQGRTYAEIAEELGISETEVQHHVAQAIAHLDRMMPPVRL